MALTYLAITDGSTTITFADGSGGHGWYRAESSWAPQITRLRRSQVGGRIPYEDVTENIPVTIGGSNAAHLYSNVALLRRLLERADLWQRGQVDTGVQLLYSPAHATISSPSAPLRAACWDGELRLAETWNVIQSGSAAQVWMTGATLSLTRRGLWTHTTASGSAALPNRSLGTVSFGSPTSLPGYLDIDLTNILIRQPTAPYPYRPYYALIGGAASDYIYSTRISTFPTGNPQWNYVDQTAQLAYHGTRVLSYVPANTLERFAMAELDTYPGSGQWAVFACCVNNSAITSFALRFGIAESLQDPIAQYLDRVTIIMPPMSSPFPVWRFMGVISVPANLGNALTYLSAIASSPSGTLYVDTIILARQPNVNILAFSYPRASVFGDYFATFSLQPRLSTGLAPNAGYASTPGVLLSDGYVAVSAASPSIVLLGTGSPSLTPYTYAMASAGSPVTNSWTLTRYTVFDTPV